MSPVRMWMRGVKSSSQISACSMLARSRSSPSSALAARTRQCTCRPASCASRSRTRKRPTKPVAPVTSTWRISDGETASAGAAPVTVARTKRRSAETSRSQCGGSFPTSGGAGRRGADVAVDRVMPGSGSGPPACSQRASAACVPDVRVSVRQPPTHRLRLRSHLPHPTRRRARSSPPVDRAEAVVISSRALTCQLNCA